MADAPLVAITGATGFIGRAMVERFLDAGWRVRALTRSSPTTGRDGVEWHGWALGDQAQDALTGATAMVHAAAALGDAPLDQRRRNVDGSIQLLADARAAGVRRCVFLSSMSAHPDAISEYGRGKLAVERAWTGPDALVIRPGLVLGDAGLAGRLLQLVTRHRVLPIVGAGRRLQTAHVEDLAHAIVTATGRDLSGCLTVAERVPVRLDALVREMARLRGARTRFVPIPFVVARTGLTAARTLRIPLPVSEDNLLGLAALRTQDVSADLDAIGVTVRDHRASLAAIVPPASMEDGMGRGSIMQWLAEPAVRAVDVDSDELLEVHRQVLLAKPMIRGVFDDIYDACMGADRRHLRGDGLRVEIGAGVSRFKDRYPEIISTDIKSSPYLDAVVDAQAMPYADGSVRAIHGINVFHHLPSPDRFFTELERVLVPGGGAILIDPYHGPLARLLYPRLFATEGYDLTQRDWDTADDAMGVMQGANQALSWIVFVRDADRLRSSHPGLEVVEMRPLTNYVRYLVSGGLNFRQLLPNVAIPGLRAAERIGSPLARWFGLHHLIVIRKRAEVMQHPGPVA